MNKTYPFFFTWTKQKDAQSFNFQPLDNFSFKTDNIQKVYDLSSISFQASFGFKPQFILDAVKAQLDDFSMTSPKAVHELKLKAAEELLDYMQLPDGKLFYTVSGAEGIENALKMARETSGRHFIAARSKSYHGATLGAVSVTGDWRNKIHGLLDKYTLRIPEPYEDPTFEKTHDILQNFGPGKIAAFCLETISGANGAYAANSRWWQELEKFAKEHQIQLILDEVVCGFGRTGEPFGYSSLDLNPDYVVMAKAISGGVIPFGAVWVSSQIASYYEDHVLSCGLTNYAHPLGLAALRAVLAKIKQPGFVQLLRTNIEEMKRSLANLKQLPSVQEVRQHGMLIGIDLKKTAEWRHFLEAGLYLTTRENSLILAPALNYDEALLKTALNVLHDSLAI